MADQISKEEKDITTNYDDVAGGRRGTLASINLNKNLDAKYVSAAPVLETATNA